jgi:hypothetical protein
MRRGQAVLKAILLGTNLRTVNRDFYLRGGVAKIVFAIGDKRGDQ